MSVANAIFSATALVLSFVAILVSVISARRQSADARLANVIMFMNELGQTIRSQVFLNAQDYVLTQLSQFDPSLGVYGLPEPAREYALRVGGFYQDLGVLVVNGVLDENLAVSLYYAGIKDVWRALEPYILGEREKRRLRGAGGMYGSFEHIAAYVESTPHEKVVQRFRRRRFPAFEVTPGAAVGGTATASGDASRPQAPKAE
jgi:hypothetical protein